MKPQIKISFTEKFLINFDGTQEDLDEIVKQIKQKFTAGEFSEKIEGNTELVIGEDEDDFDDDDLDTHYLH